MRPENAASRAVLAKAGFREEGLLRRYLEVDRAWRDHLLVALTVEEVHGSVASSLVRAGQPAGPDPILLRRDSVTAAIGAPTATVTAISSLRNAPRAETEIKLWLA